MTNEAMSPLRRRMIEDMTIRNFGPKTHHDYIRSVKNLTMFLGRSPDTATNEDVRRFQLHLSSDGISAARMNNTVSGLRFFFRVTLGRADIASHLPFVRQPHKLPIILSPEEVSRFLEAAPGLKYKAAFSVAYGAGLRAAEVISLKPTDIDSKRMVIRVEQGKGRKDRYVMLSPQLLELLRDWWHVGSHRAGCFRVACSGRRSQHASSIAPATPPRRLLSLRSLCRCIRCATASPRIFWNRTSTSG